MKSIRNLTAGLIPAALGSAMVMAQDAPFGTDADASYAAEIWTAMEERQLAGEGMLRSFPMKAPNRTG